MDIDAHAGVAMRADAHAIPLASNSVGCVICVSVLEYLAEPHRVIREVHRVLKPGGVVYLNAPFVFPYHPPPPDLWRFSVDGLRTLAAFGFEEVKVGYNRGPASTFCHLLIHFLAVLGCFNSRRLYGWLVEIAQWMFFWVKFLDKWIGHYGPGVVLHNGAFFLGRRRTESCRER